MRCLACNVELSDYESTRKDLHGDYIDMCNHCYGTIKDELLSTDREDLLTKESVSDSELDYSEWTED
jgi:hypothetical protein